MAFRKNIAGQRVGAQLVSKTDGSPVTTGSTTVMLTRDAVAQAAGTGTVSHAGNGLWLYYPSQAETNHDFIGFTFINSTAIYHTVDVWPGIKPDVSSVLGAYGPAQGIKRNTAYTNYIFPMANTSNVLQSGKTVSGTRSIDSGSWTLISGTIGELGSTGFYAADWTAGDLNGSVIAFRFAASGCQTTAVTIRTVPSG